MTISFRPPAEGWNTIWGGTNFRLGGWAVLDFDYLVAAVD